MAVYIKAKNANDIIIGAAVVGNGTDKSAPAVYDNPQRTIHLPNLDSVGYITVLDGRFDTPPSGWSGFGR